jgi:hypothetical protein
MKVEDLTFLDRLINIKLIEIFRKVTSFISFTISFLFIFHIYSQGFVLAICREEKDRDIINKC